MKCCSSKQFSLHCLWKLELVVVRLRLRLHILNKLSRLHIRAYLRAFPTTAHIDAEEASLGYFFPCFLSVFHHNFSGIPVSSYLLNALGFFPSLRTSGFCSALPAVFHDLDLPFPLPFSSANKSIAPAFLPEAMCSVFPS